jgi:hypothetical protein
LSWLERLLRVPAANKLFTARTHLVAHGFDLRYRVHTRGRAEPREMAVIGDKGAHATDYWATTARFARHMIRHLPITDVSNYTFIDMGSGKGRMLLVAAEFPFRRIIGVEFAVDLDAIARKNVKAYRNRRQLCFNLEPVLTDATRYDFPPGPLVVYFYNPFDRYVMELVIQNLDQSIAEHPRDVIVVYWNPIFSEVIEAARHLKVYAKCPYVGGVYHVYRSAISAMR